MLKQLLFSDTGSLQLGFMILRVGIGALFALHGWEKILGGTATWQWLGEQLQVFGITFMPVVWGFIAAIAEFGGGICLVLGLASRPAALLICCVMVVAIAYHINKGDPFETYSHPMALLVVMVAIVIAGSGSFSIDHCINS
jgi:putative oxidoreductase